jgi:glutaredoxin 3
MSVVMYVKPGCPYCEAAREHLRSAGEEFEERDATADPAWKAELMRHSRDTGLVPTIVRESGQVEVGFPPGRG